MGKIMWGMWKFFKMEDKADEVTALMNEAGCTVHRQCACIHDHGADQCENFTNYCPGGVYLRVPIGWEDAFQEAIDTVEDEC